MAEQSASATLEFTLGDRLRKAREMAGLDQVELAARIGVSRGTISNYEHGYGKKPPKVIILRAWAHECHVPYDELVTGAREAAASLAEAGTRSSTDRASDYGSEGWGSRPASPFRRRSDRRRHSSVVPLRLVA